MRTGAATLLAILIACTAGEAPPQGPPAPAEPATEVPAGEVPAEPADGGEAAAKEAAAAELLSRARLAYEAAELGEALDLSRRVLRDYAMTSSGGGAAWVGARSAFALRQWAEALDLAEQVAATERGVVGEEAAALAELARDELAAPATDPVRLGVLLPRTGSRIMVRYGDWLLEGIQLAAQAAEQRERRSVEVVVADDAGGARTREAVMELERQGVVAIVGPLLPQHLAEAAGARSSSGVVLISPTVPEHPTWPDVFAVNTGDARGAQELGRYAAELGLTQAALLYPRSPDYERKASAFAVEFEAMGGAVRASIPYDSGTTTFDFHMARVLAAVAPDTAYATAQPMAYDSMGYGVVMPPAPAPFDSAAAALAAADPWHGRPPQEPFALFVAAPDRDVRQIAPQIAFYGLDSAGVQVFGDEAWASASVRRVVPPRDLEGVIAASHFAPGRADALADPDFVRRYEEAYRRSLENQLPALGYDAANLVLQALPNRMTTPSALARRFSLLAGIRGATGTFSVRSDRVVRTPYLVVIRGGRLAPAPLPFEYVLPVPKPPLPDTTGGVGGVGG